MSTYLHLTNTNQRTLPPEFQADDVRFPENLVEYFLNEFTLEGGIVLDPFAGYGTTLIVADHSYCLVFSKAGEHQ